MSETIAIPASRVPSSGFDQHPKANNNQNSSSSSSEYSTSPHTPTIGNTSPAQKPSTARHSRPNFLSDAFCQDECTIINIGEPDGPPRLISYLSSSQGFAWNPEIFLPSYVDCDYEPLENRREPVHEIRLTDDEIKNMLPQ